MTADYHPAGRTGKQAVKLPIVLVLICSLAALVTGIAIGNAARKRFDKFSHGYK